ncbi:MAG: GrpB family protein [Candidatus Dormiibacterota bacterium]
MVAESSDPRPSRGATQLGAELKARLEQLGYVGWRGGPADPPAWAVWSALSARWERRITLIDLYQLEATARGIPVAELPQEERARMAAQVWAVQFPGWGLAGGWSRSPVPVEVVAYDPMWPARYADWEQRLRNAVGPVAQRLDHVGSTSVPGLMAKPVIDIQMSVLQLEDETKYAGQIARIGLPLRTRDSLHRFFCPPPTSPRTVHLHVCQSGSGWEREHLLFRDYLRAHPDVCQGYGTLKQELATIWREDRPAYTDAKTTFILDAAREAEVWAQAIGWQLSTDDGK